MKNLNLTHYLMIALFVAVFLLLRQCGSTKSAVERAEKAESNIQIDSIYFYIKGKPDTVYEDVVKWYPKLVPTFIKDTTSNKGDSLSLYRTVVEDSIFKGEIISAVDGTLAYTDFNYSFKKPIISRIDTVRLEIDTKKTIIKDPWEFYIGGSIGGSIERFNLQPAAMLRIPKKNLVVGYGYGVIDRTHNIHLYTKLAWQ